MGAKAEVKTPTTQARSPEPQMSNVPARLPFRPPTQGEPTLANASFSRFPSSRWRKNSDMERPEIDPHRKYEGRVSRISGNISCWDANGEILLDANTIYDKCLCVGDEIQFTLRKQYGSGYGNRYTAANVNLL